MLNQVSVWWHIAIVAAVVILSSPSASRTVGADCFAVQPLDTAGSWNNDLGFNNFQYGPATSYPVLLAFFFSLLQANWTYTGYDASAHVAEETVGARMSSAWGIFLSVAVSAIVGYIFLLALTTHLPDMSTLFPKTARRCPVHVSQYYFGGGSPSSTSSLRPGFGRRHPGRRDRHRDGVLWSVVGRLGRPDALRVQPATMACPASGG